MLSVEEEREIERELAVVPHPRAACIDALRIVQSRRRWISDETLAEVAERLGMSTAELDAVASFYNLLYRRPVGRHVILLCDSVTCWMLGSDGLCSALTERLGIGLGQTSRDDRFTLLPAACLGACDRAPAIMIGEDLHTSLTPGALAKLLERYP